MFCFCLFVFYKSSKIVENGVSTGYSEEEATKILSEEEVTAIADMKAGEASATAWGCDLTYDYVKINADYRSWDSVLRRTDGRKLFLRQDTLPLMKQAAVLRNFLRIGLFHTVLA